MMGPSFGNDRFGYRSVRSGAWQGVVMRSSEDVLNGSNRPAELSHFASICVGSKPVEAETSEAMPRGHRPAQRGLKAGSQACGAETDCRTSPESWRGAACEISPRLKIPTIRLSSLMTGRRRISCCSMMRIASSSSSLSRQ